MTKLAWDIETARFFQTGIDRGVLYLSDGSGVPWSGLTGFSQDFGDTDSTPAYFDGGKYLDDPFYDAFGGTLTAYTYPDEFMQFIGQHTVRDGWYLDNQGSHAFGLSFRTIVGNDTKSADNAYRIHLLYNLKAVPSDVSYETLTEVSAPVEFEWKISSRPEAVSGYVATSHAIIDSRYIAPELLVQLENILYGSPSAAPRLPSLTEVLSTVNGFGLIVITDNGDGTWTISAPPEFLTMTDSTTFQLTGVTANYLDANTYEVSST